MMNPVHRSAARGTRKASLGLAAAALAAALGCGSKSSDDGATAGASAAPLTLSPVKWNPSAVDVGTVQAVVEQGATGVLVFGSRGVQAFTSGSLVSTDGTIAAWRSASAVPSADGLTTWTLGIDSSGQLQRVGDSGMEDVSPSYGLGSDKVQSAAGSGTTTAFLLDNGVAVSDGAKLTRYTLTAHAVASTQGSVAVADGSTVRIYSKGSETDVKLEDAQLVAYDSSGKLLVATTHAVYKIETVGSTYAVPVYDGGTRTIHQLASAGASVWFSVDADLAVWKADQLAVASGGTLAPDARLVGSASGDVWAISAGALLRFSATTAAGGDEALWNSTVQPVFAAVCSNCHSPAGSGKSSSNIDLSTYAAWSSRRAAVYTRVVTQAGTPGAMPPSSSGLTLTDAQKSAIEAWSKP